MPRATRVGFADKSIQDAFLQLRNGRFEEKQLAAGIERAMNHLQEDPFTGINIPRNLWPKEYVKKFAIDNLRKYDLPQGWRLIYYLRGNEVEIVSIILEWFDHKGYEKRFGYKTR